MRLYRLAVSPACSDCGPFVPNYARIDLRTGDMTLEYWPAEYDARTLAERPLPRNLMLRGSLVPPSRMAEARIPAAL